MSAVTVQEVIQALTDASVIDRIRTHGIAPPDGMVLVPIEPTKEMILEAEEAYMPFGDMGMALLCGNLAAPKQEDE